MGELDVAPAFDRSPPWSEGAEVAVIGGCLVDPGAIVAAREYLREADFYREANRRLFRAMTEISERGEAVDPITLFEALRDAGELQAVGGYDYLARLVDAVPSAANIEYHAKIVAEKATLRRIVEASSQTIRDAYDAQRGEAEGVAEEAERRIFEAVRTSASGGFRKANEFLWDAFEKIEEEQKAGGGITGLPTGFPKLNRLTAGLQPGDLSILAARPSMGKTAMALGIGGAVASFGPIVSIESLEMSNDQLIKRLLSMRGRIDSQRLRTGSLGPEDHERLARAAGWLNTLPLYLDDELGGTIAGLRAKARRLKKERGLDLLVVDYLQLMSGEGDNRIQEIGSITRGLKRIARELNLHVLALSQLSRKPESRNPPRPILSDLRDSGDIEQDADNVFLLWRPEYYFDDSTPPGKAAEWEGKGELIVAKQRNGPTDRLYLSWDKRTTTFSESASKADEARAMMA